MKMMKNRIAMIMITPGMIIILITLTVVIVVLSIVARNERLAINLTVLIKSINGVARGNVKRSVHMYVSPFLFYTHAHTHTHTHTRTQNIHIYSFIYSAWRGKGSSRSSSKSSTKSSTKCNTVSKKVVGLASFSQTKQYLANPNRYMDIA